MHDNISVRGGIPWFANVLHITRYQNLTHDIRSEATLQKKMIVPQWESQQKQ